VLCTLVQYHRSGHRLMAMLYRLERGRSTVPRRRWRSAAATIQSMAKAWWSPRLAPRRHAHAPLVVPESPTWPPVAELVRAVPPSPVVPPLAELLPP